MPTVAIEYDHEPGPDEPLTQELGYDELDPLEIGALARSGDQGAIDWLNAHPDLE